MIMQFSGSLTMDGFEGEYRTVKKLDGAIMRSACKLLTDSRFDNCTLTIVDGEKVVHIGFDGFVYGCAELGESCEIDDFNFTVFLKWLKELKLIY